MVLGKKTTNLPNSSTKPKDPPPHNSSQKGTAGGGAAKSGSMAQNGSSSAFRTDSAIAAPAGRGERPLQKWVPDTPDDTNGSLESWSDPSAPWDQFAEHNKRFGTTTDYDESIYTTSIDKSHPLYKQRLAEAERKAREIERSAATNSHVAEERVTDYIGSKSNGLDEEEKYSGVRRQDTSTASSSNRYTPPARRAPTAQSTVSGAPVDPAIISAQLARPGGPSTERGRAALAPTAPKAKATTPPITAESSSTATPEPKAAAPKTPATSSHTASPQVKPDDAPNATATVEQAVASAFKGFAAQQRRNVDQIRSAKAKNDKEIKLNDLKKFADNFKLHTPVPSDLVPIIAKDPVKQKEIQEKAKRNAEEARNNPPEAAKASAPTPEAKPAQRPVSTAHATTPSTVSTRQNRNPGFQPYGSQTYRGDRPTQPQQPTPPQQHNRPSGNLTSRLRHLEQQKQTQMPPNPAPAHEARTPPTGPSNPTDPNFSRRSSGVASAQGGRLNPNSNEFRPRATAFNPSGNNASNGSSPRAAAPAVEQQQTPATVHSLIKRKPVPESERASVKDKFDALNHIKAIKPLPEKNWEATGGLKPAYDTPPTWRQLANDEKPESTMHLTYTKLFELTPFPIQTLSPSNPSHAVPQVPHQHQLPFHLQQGVHGMASRQSPRQPSMNLPGNQHGHGPNASFNGTDDHRMIPSHSAQSFASPRLQNLPMAFPSPMNQPTQLAYNPQMMPYPGAPPMPQYRSLSQNHQFMPQQTHMGPPIMMQNPANGFMTSPPGPQMMYPQGSQGHFMPPGNGHPPAMPGVNGYPSPGRSAPMMMSQGSQQGHQQPMYGMNPGMSPGPQYGAVTPVFAQQQTPGQVPMRGYGGPNQFGTSPQQMHQFGPQQHRNNHPNGNYNNNKNFQHGQHPNGPPNNQIPTGPQGRGPEGGDEAK